MYSLSLEASLLLPPLWTCTVAGETAGNSVSYYHHTWFLDLSPSDPQRWGALSEACHPGCRWRLSFCLPFGLALLLVRQLATAYHTIITPGSWTCRPQTHRGGVHFRRPITQVVVGISPSASPLDLHCCWRDSW